VLSIVINLQKLKLLLLKRVKVLRWTRRDLRKSKFDQIELFLKMIVELR